jgi:malate dehydrogenase (oxaloacetate-decarboxylating)(NADP+)
MYLPCSARGRVQEVLRNWPVADIRFIVVTDGERILGLGDLGVGGMGIPIGKLALYTACAGVPPQYCLPVLLDVGTNNQALLDDPLYLGLRQARIRGADYDDFVDEFVAAVQALFPKCCIQWEDFANTHAVPILARYRDSICTYNDDIQGTAAVALAGVLAALRISKQTLVEQRFLFLGGGSAATGIAELISQAMALQGLDIDVARQRNALFDVNGLLVKSRSDLGPSSVPIPIRRRARNARPRRPIVGRRVERSSRAAVPTRPWRSRARRSCRGRETMSTSFPPWAWRCLPPKLSG